MKEIPLSQGKIALVDDQDFETLSRRKWYAWRYTLKSRVAWYAMRGLYREDGSHQIIGMHRAILPGVAQVDHIDGDGLNNQRANLRPATPAQNQQNGFKRAGCSSRFKGVSWDGSRNKWKAQIGINYCVRNLGWFETEEAAARAYDAAAQECFGEFARLNFPQKMLTRPLPVV